MQLRRDLGPPGSARLLALGLIAGVLGAAVSGDCRAQPVSYETVVLSGDPVPGAEPGVAFSDLGVLGLSLNAGGQLVFGANVSGPGVTLANDLALLSYSGGPLRLIARTGQPAPGVAPGYRFEGLDYNPVLNNAGQTAFFAGLAGGPSGSQLAHYLDTGGALQLSAQRGDPVPLAGPSAAFRSFGELLQLNDGGQIAYLALVDNSTSAPQFDQAIVLQSGAALGLVALTGDAAPGAGPGVRFGALRYDPVLNDLGQTAFLAELAGAGVDGANSFAIFSQSNGPLAMVARAGDPAPGARAGVRFGDMSNAYPELNNAGATAFLTGLTGAGVDASNGRAIYLSSGGTLELVARAGDAPSLLGPGEELGPQLGRPSLNQSGQIAFQTRLTGPGLNNTNNLAVFTAAGGDLNLVARGGDAAPVAAPGVSFAFLGEPVLNDNAQVAFLATLTGAGVNGSNDLGVFGADSQGVLRLIFREGDPFDVNPDPLIDDIRTIQNIGFYSLSNGSGGRPTSFNAAGQLAATLRFTDGTQGVFIATIRVPEPASLTLQTLAGAALLGAWRARRRRSTPGDNRPQAAESSPRGPV
ncbi:DUF7453 family protein [Pirellulimonas nuda]|uniref:DUF7453 family protein n=1 Tax=Pirellulimonas nuda TaxID=2528009 RepID=UPI0011A578A9|nr:choice-of-anchor tandem repeat NxxGxxAF-containing protein [Pirellulimonas nuda]